MEDTDPKFDQYGPKIVDFKDYLDADSISRVGKIFTPEFMLGGNKNVLHKPQTDKGAGWGNPKPITDLKAVEEKDIEDCIESFKMPKQDKTAVSRLLKHLKKARLQNF